MKNKKQKVVVAMSGGVDSSVAALLLKGQGYEVIGVFMRFWSPDEKYKMPHCSFENLCCSAEARRVAEKTANKLKIPFHILDLREFFKKNIVDYFVDEYLSGRTPNPCVMCGQKIKFEALFQKARKIFEADFVATGHYVRVKREQIIPRFNSGQAVNSKQLTKYKLLKGKDKNKDQSYFLYTATQNVLKHFLFPLGDYTKEQVRKIAKENKLPSYKRAESQEICFVPFGDYKDFLKTQVGLNKFTSLEINHSKRLSLFRQRRESGFLTGFKSGKIVDTGGNIIGEHQGIAFYTIGQRRGIHLRQGFVGQVGDVSYRHKNTANKTLSTTDKNRKPLYVVDIKARKNIVVVGMEKDLYKNTLIAKNVNWISGIQPKSGEKVKAKIRYQMIEQEATVHPKGKKLRVEFRKPQRAITCGQSVVLYKGNKVLGGGIIDKVL